MKRLTVTNAIVILVSFLSLLLSPVVGFAEEGEALAEAAWKSTAKLSYVRTSGNTDSETIAGSLESSYEPDANRYYLNAAVLFTEQNNVESANRWFIEGRYERGLTERFFLWASTSYLKDKFSGYDSQITIGPGAGYYFLKEEGLILKGLAGLLYTFDEYTDGGSDDYLSAKAAGDLKWQIMDNLAFRELLTYRLSFADSDIYFIDSESSLDVKMADNLSLGVSYIVNYQNDAPIGTKDTDTRFLTSLVVNF